ncbi:F0F1 ATP synthase subunit B' [Maricaulis sp.]|jgi:F-type H+-transporting ATPase subunit b|uniref:F0F1 ATP synthase subunit B family protein n=1 Tax=Maricaulis sp. TaxID=1486257 RepID=UPI0025F2BBD2|nr:F0F1 ATP synthase subunit B' [Maricaulis sp.]MDF1768482.1 F0F1 ATP synthase subunit B' [Maricaulis sp.]
MTHAPHSEVAQHVADAAADHADSGVFPPFDPTYFASQLFWLTIFFVILYVALDRFILPKIKTTIEDRRDRIADDLDAAAQAKADAEAAGEAYEKSLAEARTKAHVIAADTRKALDAEIAKETAGVEAELATKQETAEAAIRKAKEKAFSEVRGIATTATSAAVAALAGVDVSEADAGKAVDGLLKAKEA